MSSSTVTNPRAGPLSLNVFRHTQVRLHQLRLRGNLVGIQTRRHLTWTTNSQTRGTYKQERSVIIEPNKARDYYRTTKHVLAFRRYEVLN